MFELIICAIQYKTRPIVKREAINAIILGSHLPLKKVESDTIINERSNATINGIIIDAPILRT